MLALAAPAHAQFETDSETLVKAVRAQNAAKVQDIVGTAKADVINRRAFDGSTALTAAVEMHNMKFASFLLDHGADPELPGKGGVMALSTAAELGWLEGVDMLLRYGAKVDTANRQGETALIVAVQLRNLPIVRRLLLAGADPDRTDHAAGMSARDYAKRDNRVRDTLRLIESVHPAKPAR